MTGIQKGSLGAALLENRWHCEETGEAVRKEAKLFEKRRGSNERKVLLENERVVQMETTWLYSVVWA
jgi:hypothetical protein